MKNNSESFETMNSARNVTGAARVRDDYPSVLKKNLILLFLFAASLVCSLVWCFSLPVRAEEAGTEEVSTEESDTEERRTEETDTERSTEAVNEAEDQNVSEQIKDFIDSFQDENGDGQSISEQIEDFISSFQDEDGDGQSISGQIEDFIGSFQNEDGDGQSISEQIGDFISSLQDGEDESDGQNISAQLESFFSSLLDQSPDADTQAAAELVEDIPTTQYFTDEPVADEDIEAILNAGINSPSAMNSQSWHFSVVTDVSLLQQIADEMNALMGIGVGSVSDTAASEDTEEEAEASVTVTKAGIADAPLAIIISCPDGSELDAGLACQTMSVEAQLLGYGSKIISSPASVLNGDNQEEYQELLGIPDDYSVVAILLVGYEDTSIDESVDGYTSATTRNSLEDMVTYVEP